mmetsp:Transcript_26090/g.57159  ORF Transcript_26090/g.57159 Transcript_26090/m.57159 type:complete len:315 (-) Transcript_26090:284-1228(-)
MKIKMTQTTKIAVRDLPLILAAIYMAFCCCCCLQLEFIGVENVGIGSRLFVQSFVSYNNNNKFVANSSSRSRCTSSSIRLSNRSSSDDLREKAAALRREVEEFEASKQKESDQIRQQAETVQRQKEETRLRYIAEVPILKGDGTVSMERCDFSPPRIMAVAKRDEKEEEEQQEQVQVTSRILTFQAPLPLGIVLGQEDYGGNSNDNMRLPPITVDDLAAGGNAEQAGVRVGDILRACTACQVTMEQPTWQLMMGGVGRPTTTRMMFSTDDKAFEEVMDAIGSNGMDPESRDVWLVVERRTDNDNGDDTNGTGTD